MRTIDQQLEIIHRTKKIGLMTHVVVGYPTLAETEQIVLAMESAGADFVELQIPFSDPLADGPTIMQANDVAIKGGVEIEDIFVLLGRLKKQVTIPLLLMGYYNSLYHYGVARFCRRAQKLGVAGLIIPDIPVDEEESEHFIATCLQHGLLPIRVLSPTSTVARIKQNVRVAQGFIYCTAVAGTTGGHYQIDAATKTLLKRVRRTSRLPIALGFGIARPEHVVSLVGVADIAVVGSVVITLIAQKGSRAVSSFIRSLVTPTITGTIEKTEEL